MPESFWINLPLPMFLTEISIESDLTFFLNIAKYYIFLILPSTEEESRVSLGCGLEEIKS